MAAIGDPALPAFAELLRDPDPEVRKTAIGALGQLASWRYSGGAGEVGINLIPQVEVLASDPDIGVRIALAAMLAGCQDNSRATSEPLRLLARDPAVEVRLAVAKAFGRPGVAMNGAASWWLELAKDRDRMVRIAVVAALPQAGLAKATLIDRLLDALKDPDAEVRAAAAGRLADERQPVWVADKTGRSPVWGDMRKLLGRSPTAFAAIRSALADPDPRVRAAATRLLPVFKAEAVDLIPALKDGLKGPDERVRIASAVALAGFGPDSRCATRALLALLADPAVPPDGDEPISAHAARALAAIGGDAKAKLCRVLFSQLNSLEAPTRARARRNLVAVGDRVLHEIFQTLADSRATTCVHVEALVALNRILSGRSFRLYFVHSSEGNPPGAEAPAMMSVLRTLSRYQDPQVRHLALGMMAEIDPHAPEIPAMYFAGLRECEDENEGKSASELSDILKPAMIPELARGLLDQESGIRLAAVETLAELAAQLVQNGGHDRRSRTEAARAFLRALKDPDPRVRRAAAESLGLLHVEGEAVIPALIAMAKTDKACVAADDLIETRSSTDRDLGYDLGDRKKGGDPLQIAAIRALGSFRGDAAPAVPELVRALRDDDLRVRWFAAEALAMIGPKANAAVPALIEALGSGGVAEGAGDLGGAEDEGQGMEDGPIRLMAAVALGRIASEPKEAVPALIRAASDPDSRVRAEAARSLMAIGGEPVAILPVLVRQATRCDSEEVAGQAREYLSQLGPAAIPPLVAVVRDRNSGARLSAIETLGKFGGSAAAAIPELIACRNDPDLGIRVAAIGALGSIGPVNVDVIPALVNALGSPESDVSDATCEALNLIGKPALPAILALLRSEDEVVRKRAVAILSYMGSSGIGSSEDRAVERRRATCAALLSASIDRDRRVRSAATDALKDLASGGVPGLVSELDDPSDSVRIAAARTLGAIGEEARDALEPLRRHQADADPEVRHAVVAAIRAIEETNPEIP